MTTAVTLRDVTPADLPIFFQHGQHPAALHMAAFTAPNPADRHAFMAHWTAILADDTIFKQTILFHGRVAGSIYRFQQDGRPEVGYWLGQEFWGQGIATAALAQFLRLQPARPLYARAAADNVASLRVLQKCGFTIIGYEAAFANARLAIIQEAILRLDAFPTPEPR